MKDCTALAVVLMWTKLFYWMNQFSSYAYYVRLLKATLSDIWIFLTIFIICLMMFGNALLILNEKRYGDTKLIQKVFANKFVDALMN